MWKTGARTYGRGPNLYVAAIFKARWRWSEVVCGQSCRRLRRTMEVVEVQPGPSYFGRLEDTARGKRFQTSAHFKTNIVVVTHEARHVLLTPCSVIDNEVRVDFFEAKRNLCTASPGCKSIASPATTIRAQPLLLIIDCRSGICHHLEKQLFVKLHTFYQVVTLPIK